MASDPPSIRSSTIDSRAWEVVDDCVFAYEEDCKNGKRQPLDRYVPSQCDDLLRQAILVELVKVDLELQWDSGRFTRLDHYCQQYSALGPVDDLPADLVYEAFRVACHHGTSDSAEQFCNDYPKQRPAVIALARRSVRSTTAHRRGRSIRQFRSGEAIDDFELLTLLGKGAFGQVFLARQRSLARQVALKITENRGSEARTMASLEHDNIVQVFSESVHSDSNIRLLCMQYIPGTNLSKVIHWLSQQGLESFSGAHLIEATDELSSAPALFQAVALKERESLAKCDQIEAVCWIGQRLAEALACAHRQGVLHRDIKPDNILISLYGRPMLADFNLSLDPHETGGTAAGMFGGSLAYMSPEHLDAFNPVNATPPSAVDERSDIFSLGVVLFELLTLQPPFANQISSSDQVKVLEQLADERSRGAPLASTTTTEDVSAIDLVLAKCLRPNPDDRYQTGASLAEALNAASEMRRIERDLPKSNSLLHLGEAYPFQSFLVVALLPHLLGSGVNISYNLLRIVPQLTDLQRSVFSQLVIGYNAIVYPVCILWLGALAMPVFRSIWRGRSHSSNHQRTRRRLLAFPVWLATISTLGWLPGGFLFPFVLNAVAGPIPLSVFAHFVADFAISGMIAATYAYLGVETIFLRFLYPKFLIQQDQPRATAALEIKHIAFRLRAAQILAGAIPLAGAVLLVGIGPDDVSGYGVFRILVSVLIVAGMLGFCLSIGLAGYLRRVISALTGFRQ